MQIEVKSVRRLRIDPGEVLVVRLPNDASVTQDVADRVRRTFADALPDGVTVIVTTIDMALEVVAADAVARA